MKLECSIYFEFFTLANAFHLKYERKNFKGINGVQLVCLELLALNSALRLNFFYSFSLSSYLDEIRSIMFLSVSLPLYCSNCSISLHLYCRITEFIAEIVSWSLQHKWIVYKSIVDNNLNWTDTCFIQPPLVNWMLSFLLLLINFHVRRKWEIAAAVS